MNFNQYLPIPILRPIFKLFSGDSCRIIDGPAIFYSKKCFIISGDGDLQFNTTASIRGTVAADLGAMPLWVQFIY